MLKDMMKTLVKLLDKRVPFPHLHGHSFIDRMKSHAQGPESARRKEDATRAEMSPEQMSVRLELFVQDMDQAIAFYTQILGFKVLRRLKKI